MQKLVIVHHLNDVQHYLFSVPEGRDVDKGDLVLVRNSRGEVPAVCVCSSFSVPENVAATLHKKYGGSELKPVIGSVHLYRWGEDDDIPAALAELEAYKKTGVSAEELRRVTDMFNEFVAPDVPKELGDWMERCIWHVKKCSEQHGEIERLKRELEEMKRKEADKE